MGIRLGELRSVPQKDLTDLTVMIEDLRGDVRDLIARHRSALDRISELENELAVCESANERLREGR